jgi:hypothetical protein
MTNQEYRESLESPSVTKKILQSKYEGTFLVRPPSRYKKGDLIDKLVEKFTELNQDNPHAEDVKPEEPVVITTPSTPRSNNGKPSRRSTIIQLVTQNIWDTDTLAEWLNLVNPEWPVKKNKVAISGTLTDMKRNHNWTVKPDDKGRIVVGNC